MAEFRRGEIKGISFKQPNGFNIASGDQLLLERVGRIIMTYKSERVNNLEFGSLLETMLFQRGNILPQHVKQSLIQDIEHFEPNVKVLRATVSYTNTEAKINILLQRRDTLAKLVFETEIALDNFVFETDKEL